MNSRPLTEKEQKVIQTFEAARPGLGAIAESNIRNNDRTGWADIIETMDESEIILSKGTAFNSFCYRRIG